MNPVDLVGFGCAACARVQIKCFKRGVVRERSAHFEHFPIGSAVEKVAKLSPTGSVDFCVILMTFFILTDW